MTKKKYVLGTLAIVVGLLAGAFLGYWAESHEPAPTQFHATAQVAGTTSPIHLTYSGTGVFKVPEQFSAGSYVVTAGAGDFGCYWERLRSLDGKDSSVLSSGNASRGSYQRLVVTSKDRAVAMVGDCVWIKR